MTIDTTTLIAWWGAILSSLVLFWDIYKWWSSGPKIRFTVQTGMESINMPGFDGKTLILANVTNYGEQPTTITNLGLLYYKSIWSLIRKRPDQAFVIPNPNTDFPLPFQLKQGSVWAGITVQDDQITEMATKGKLYCVLYHSHSEKPMPKKVIVRSNSSFKRAWLKPAL